MTGAPAKAGPALGSTCRPAALHQSSDSICASLCPYLSGFLPWLTRLFLKRILFIYFYREGTGGRRKERGGETSISQRYINLLPLTCSQLGTWLATQACALTENQTGDPLVCRRTLNPLSHTSLGSTRHLVPALADLKRSFLTVPAPGGLSFSVLSFSSTL